MKKKNIDKRYTKRKNKPKKKYRKRKHKNNIYKI